VEENTLTLRPVESFERNELIDILRGFALLGILLVNFRGGISDRLIEADRLVSDGLNLLVRHSFYPLFSLLFGVGFAIQLRRAESRGTPFTQVYIRRLAVLFTIGTVHSVLIWSGDILVDYAVFGLLLIPLQRLHPRLLATLIVGLTIVQLERDRITTEISWTAPSSESLAQRTLRQGLRDEETAIRANALSRVPASFPSDVATRWIQYGNRLAAFIDWRSVVRRDLLLIFLVGFLVGRKQWFEPRNREIRARRFVITAVIGACAAVSGGCWTHFVQDSPVEMERGAWMLSNYGMTALYVGVIATIVGRSRRLLYWFEQLAPVGKAAMSNYLLQSLTMTWLFASYGANMNYPSATLWALLNGAFFFLVQVPLSRWWLESFNFGPVEWLWRSATYGKRQAFRRRAARTLEEPAATGAWA
jgi:uncharacterized protein